MFRYVKPLSLVASSFWLLGSTKAAMWRLMDSALNYERPIYKCITWLGLQSYKSRSFLLFIELPFHADAIRVFRLTPTMRTQIQDLFLDLGPPQGKGRNPKLRLLQPNASPTPPLSSTPPQRPEHPASPFLPCHFPTHFFSFSSFGFSLYILLFLPSVSWWVGRSRIKNG